MQVGAKHAKTCMQRVHIPTEYSNWASVVHTTIGGWVVVQDNW